jgi:hypothetical protein
VSGAVGFLVKWIIVPTFVLSLFAVPLAVAWNALAIKGLSVTGGATMENAQNIGGWIEEGRTAAADRNGGGEG